MADTPWKWPLHPWRFGCMTARVTRLLPGPIQQLVELFAQLPGVGEKTAQRFALHLACGDLGTARALGEALVSLADSVGQCARCRGLAERGAHDRPPVCDICRDSRRDPTMVCVVARIQDLLSIERSNAFRGHYFVLGNLLSPLEGIRAEQLPIDALLARLGDPERPVREVLVATPPSVDGEATALLLAERLRPLGVEVSRLASGIPHGGEIEYSDPVTIGRAIAGRRGLGS